MTTPKINITATGSAPHIVLVDGEQKSQHTSEHIAHQEAANHALANPSAEVRVERKAEWQRWRPDV